MDGIKRALRESPYRCITDVMPSLHPWSCPTGTIFPVVLPDKAIDLEDEAAARLRLEWNSVPEEGDRTRP